MKINSELPKQHGGGHGGLRYCGIELFFKSLILILMCGIAVSSSPAVVCGDSSFLLTVFGKRRSFTVLPAVPFICTLLSNTAG